ncbi:CAP domain-containing protein [Streptomyces sp. NRRL S-237]|uniref:CAP domain-containing protein n=1 Tax=Streptomyces sp. NRRL S-237 TaxID=1463895 RepID=UPI0004C9468F|nr:CAP domain-containing protein [Streptomyces sp. NRRL S-237]
MQFHDDGFTYGSDVNAAADPNPEANAGGSRSDRRGRARAAGRAAGGHRKGRRRTPLMAAAAVVLLAGVGSAYALISDEAPQRTAATGSPSALAGWPGAVDGLPTATASPTAAADATASPAAGASASTSASASASASAPAPGPAARSEDGGQRSGAPATERAPGPSTPPTRSTSGNGPTGPDPKVPGPRTTTQDVATAQSLSLQLLNAERAAVGRPPLALKQDLSAFARKWAEHMRNNAFAHSSSDDRAYLKTGSRTWTGENIVWFSDASMTAQEAAEKFQSMWRHSSGHYKAQVNPDFTEVGVGLYHDSTGWWGVHNFSDGK